MNYLVNFWFFILSLLGASEGDKKEMAQDNLAIVKESQGDIIDIDKQDFNNQHPRAFIRILRETK